MIFLYTFLIILLGIAHFLFRRRAMALEKKFVRIARQADGVLRQSITRPGNATRHDLYESAKRQYQLAMLATKRDRVEARYGKWQGRADRLGKLRARLRNWKGKKLPYTLGVLDVAGALALVDYLGAGRYVNAHALVEAVTALFTR
jgi:hypothetical protein